MNWTVQCAEYYLSRGVSRTNAYEFMQQSGSHNQVEKEAMEQGQRISKALALALTAAIMWGSYPQNAQSTPSAVEEMKSLYEELQGFKESAEFRQVIYGRCCKYHAWKLRVEALNAKGSFKEFMNGFGILPGELVQLGYFYGKGDLEAAEIWERRIDAVQSPLEGVERADRIEADRIIGEWSSERTAYWMGSEDTITRKNGVVQMIQRFTDGSSRTETLEEITPLEGQLRRFRVTGNNYGEYYATLPGGTLGAFDVDGLIYEGRPK